MIGDPQTGWVAPQQELKVGDSPLEGTGFDLVRGVAGFLFGAGVGFFGVDKICLVKRG